MHLFIYFVTGAHLVKVSVRYGASIVDIAYLAHRC